jgi:hypothetical protein
MVGGGWWDGSGKCGCSGAIRGRVLAVAATEKFPELLRPCVRPRALRVPRLALPLSCPLARLDHSLLFARIQCHGPVYVEKQCPRLEELFLCASNPSWATRAVL